MGLKHKLYEVLPETAKKPLRQVYSQLTGRKSDEDYHNDFVDDLFGTREEYLGFVNEFEGGPLVGIWHEALDKYRTLTGKETLSGVGLGIARDYYAVTRNLKPPVIVETGVCNGLSTLALLLAVERNESGHLYSIDYPFRADESLAEFREDTFEGYGGAAIPSDKDPGWIIPDDLRGRWSLILGKSQRQLPLLAASIGEFDLFVHDSEHSHPCMMFEYELAYHWLTEGGVILSDDIRWNDAFPLFVRARKARHGRLSNSVGYIVKGV